MKPALKTNPANKAASFVKGHQLIIGLLLVFFGVSDLSFVMPNLYGTFRGFYVNWQVFYFYLPEWRLTIPVLLAMALIGTLMLTVYCVRDIGAERIDNKEYAAVLVSSLGFAYLVLGLGRCGHNRTLGRGSKKLQTTETCSFCRFSQAAS